MIPASPTLRPEVARPGYWAGQRLILPAAPFVADTSLRRLQFGSFLVLTATLFLRPGDMFPALEAVPFYLLALVACVALSLPLLLEQLNFAALRARPITLCVLGLLVVGPLSNAVHGDWYDARQTLLDFLKFVLFYLLLVGVVDTPQRLRLLLLWVAAFIVAECGLALLQYHNLIDIQAPAYLEAQDQIDTETGLPVVLARLCGSGIFDNPNDLARILVVGLFICLYFLTDRQQTRRRYWWMLPLAVLGYGLQLTYSRGGFLALLAGAVVLTFSRFGRVRSWVICALLLPVMFLLFAGRTTDIDTEGGTAQQRIQLWRDSFQEMKASPVLGIGVNHLADEIGGLWAHNSFVQCYAEMGLVGGTLFAGAFYLALVGPYRFGPYAAGLLDVELRRFRPYLLAIIGGVVVGMFSSTRCYRIETYLLLGLVTVFLRLGEIDLPQLALRMNRALVKQIVLVGVAVLAAFYVYVRVAAH